MVVGEIAEPVDLLVVGGGPGGYVAAIRAARLGRSVVLVDADGEAGLGGTCVRVGCIPSKALIGLAEHSHDRAMWSARGAAMVTSSDPDLARFQAWKSELVNGLNDGVRGLLRRAGVEVRTGWFRFTRRDQGALVTDLDHPPTHLRFRSCIIATGSRPLALSAVPFDGMNVLSSTDLLALTELPASLVVVGGGYIGLELGTALAKLGASVTIVEAENRLLPTMHVEVSSLATDRLRQLGVTVMTSTRVVGITGQRLGVENPEGSAVLESDAVLVAVGRVPNTDDIGIEALGVRPDTHGRFTVGPDLLVTPAVAALGDITPGPALAHKAMAEAVVAASVLSGVPASFDPAAIPTVVFSDPLIAEAGLTQAGALAAGYRVRTARFPASASGRSRIMGSSPGYGEFVIDDDSGIILGATIVGPHADDLIAETALAIEMAAHLDDVAGTIHPHPTMSEMLMEAAHVGLGSPIHIPAASDHKVNAV